MLELFSPLLIDDGLLHKKASTQTTHSWKLHLHLYIHNLGVGLLKKLVMMLMMVCFVLLFKFLTSNYFGGLLSLKPKFSDTYFHLKSNPIFKKF